MKKSIMSHLRASLNAIYNVGHVLGKIKDKYEILTYTNSKIKLDSYLSLKRGDMVELRYVDGEAIIFKVLNMSYDETFGSCGYYVPKIMKQFDKLLDIVPKYTSRMIIMDPVNKLYWNGNNWVPEFDRAKVFNKLSNVKSVIYHHPKFDTHMVPEIKNVSVNILADSYFKFIEVLNDSVKSGELF